MDKNKKELPVFDLVISDDAEGMVANSFVKNPAHGQSFVMFAAEDKTQQKFAVEEEKGWVTGPLIVPGLRIYRKATATRPEREVRFTREEIERIAINYARNGYFNRVTFQHDVPVDGATLIEYWFAGEQDKSHVLGLRPAVGTLMGTYFIEDPHLKAAIKNGDVTGFSIEGFFDHVEAMMSEQDLKDIGEMLEVVTDQDRELEAHFKDATLSPEAWKTRLDEILTRK